jgi:hypothetical protein
MASSQIVQYTRLEAVRLTKAHRRALDDTLEQTYEPRLPQLDIVGVTSPGDTQRTTLVTGNGTCNTTSRHDAVKTRHSARGAR